MGKYITEETDGRMSIEERLARIERLLILSTKEMYDTAEAALFLGISPSQVRHKVIERSIPHYKHGSRNFFKRSELEEWLQGTRVPTQDEVEAEAATILACRRIRGRY